MKGVFENLGRMENKNKWINKKKINDFRIEQF